MSIHAILYPPDWKGKEAERTYELVGKVISQPGVKSFFARSEQVTARDIQFRDGDKIIVLFPIYENGDTNWLCFDRPPEWLEQELQEVVKGYHGVPIGAHISKRSIRIEVERVFKGT